MYYSGKIRHVLPAGMGPTTKTKEKMTPSLKEQRTKNMALCHG